MAEKKSKTDVTARDKSGRATDHSCSNCGQQIMNDRDMVVVAHLFGLGAADDEVVQRVIHNFRDEVRLLPSRVATEGIGHRA